MTKILDLLLLQIGIIINCFVYCLQGYVRQKQFIATQAPLPQTLVDFWRLIWQENVEYVIMLLRDLTEGGLIRCQQYWPDSGTSFYGPYKVSLECIEEHTNYKLRIFQLSVSCMECYPLG